MPVIGNDEATKPFATRPKDDLQPNKCAIVATFEQLLINGHLTAIIHHLKTRGLLSRVIIDEAHLLLQGRGWRAAFSGLGDSRYKIGVGTQLILMSASLPRAAIVPLRRFFCMRD